MNKLKGHICKTGIKDSDGIELMVGDRVRFNYGIPLIGVVAPIVKQRGIFWCLTPDHNPKRCKLSKLREYVGDFYKD
jgi:hypothetical protein